MCHSSRPRRRRQRSPGPLGQVLPTPVWQIAAEMRTQEFGRCKDFRYITDAITLEEVIEML